MVKFQWISSTLNSFAQIGFQQNRFIGLLFMLAIVAGAPILLLSSLITVQIANLTASLLQVDKTLLNSGIYGYNAALLGIALAIWLPLSPITIMVLIIGAVMTVIIMALWLKLFCFKPYSSPFIVSSWLVIAALSAIDYPFNAFSVTSSGWSLPEAVLNGIAQVAFQQNELSGVIILIALVISRWQCTGWILWAAVSSSLFADILVTDAALIQQGFFCFNAILAILVLLSNPSFKKRWWLLFLSPFACVLLSQAFLGMNIIAFTAPFVLLVYSLLIIDFLKEKQPSG
ncbi:urea transporter [Oceanospirillum sediminis]|uniref:Urea transporter n=1 Tax=Oceanospirillum sediminis TaxID=2760088 RepID=A0A839INQ3_9GAMM|nr:urea transporter [Oceanospirillum sediminis]MBB1486129.1 urea transporter [Oceanospirillum sediminis]